MLSKCNTKQLFVKSFAFVCLFCAICFAQVFNVMLRHFGRSKDCVKKCNKHVLCINSTSVLVMTLYICILSYVYMYSALEITALQLYTLYIYSCTQQ